MARYRRSATNHFQSKQTPYNAIDGERERLSPKSIRPFCAMMQVAVEDTHDDYVICRGFDTRVMRYFDYVEGDPDKKGIAVAKPYGVRGTKPYVVGEIHAAFLPVLQLSDTHGASYNPAKAETTVGHPADLDEKIVALNRDDGVAINWMFAEAGTGSDFELVEMCLAEDHPGRHTTGATNLFTVYKGVWNEDTDTWEYDDEVTTYTAFDRRYGTPFPDAGSKGLFTPRASTTYGTIYEVVSLDCESPGTCDD